MGTGEESTPAKSSKSTSSAQEAPTMPSYPDWSSSMQAYYGAGGAPPAFFASTVGSPSPHPYMWGSQHPLMPPYGTVPYPALYPPGGVYAHPNMATTPTSAKANVDLEGKVSNGKDRSSAKKSKGTSGNAGNGSKAGESGKATSGSGYDGASQSADSGSEDSSDASDENTNEQELSASNKRSFNQMLAAASAGTMKIGQSPTGVSSAVAPGTMVGREGVVPDQWVQQDERELKRQKRKQSNRESARRSRLRKQAECEELQRRVETLSNENSSLKDELQMLSEECEKITSENNSIEEELKQLYGPDAVSIDGISNLKENILPL